MINHVFAAMLLLTTADAYCDSYEEEFRTGCTVSVLFKTKFSLKITHDFIGAANKWKSGVA